MKLIAIDMDGTLLNSRNEISRENIEAVKRAQSKGIEVVIATGRAYFDAFQHMKEAGLSTWIIGANGSTIHDKDGTRLQSISVRKGDAEEILKYFTENGFYYEVFSEHKLYSPQNGRELLNIELDRVKTANPDADLVEMNEAAERQFSQEPFEFVTSYKEILEETDKYYNLLAFSFDDKKLKEAWDRYADRDDLTLTASASHVFDIMHRDVSKGNAVMKLAEKFGVGRKDIMAIGDNFNDVSMFNIAGVSVAMENAPDGVKEQAKFVTLKNNEHGVAHIIAKMIK
ncbi:Cof-type HAD-IIB family hydrolase [Domibacillus epiphyticus]|uniref:Phosphatase n=1 Tax=Domibacillus epiphyticus TaxID=1714355 RepID=A0A1V2ABI6_9BACI|nr:Cof-type HAD-IIB family hydrolase [Domibacillus epiphyticus]OMP68349.1 phosphatase [Domibacillus epiphyticus]